MDRVFAKPIVKQFEFDEEVAAVFDDMLTRSIPFYKQTQNLSVELLLNYLNEGDVVYDLGSSTASFLVALAKKAPYKLKLYGIDSSTSMVEQARKKVHAYGVDVKLEHGDILEYNYQSANLFVSNYTLQFIRPLQREELVAKIFSTLKKGGVFLFSEKLISNDKKLNKELISLYYNYKKKQGYSEYEIAQKREALENVLVPYTQDENITMLKKVGFSHCEVVFRWGNFATFIAIK